MSGDVSRRRFALGLAAAAGLTVAGCRPQHWFRPGRGPGHTGMPGDRPDPFRPEGVDLLPQIEHIVIYMQENHSYDSYFGAFRPRGDGYCFRDGVPTNSNVLPDGQELRVFRAPSTCQFGQGVSQSWVSTHTQIDGGKMDGFLRDGNTNAMQYWDGQDLPFYWSLASTFPMCDRWFASAPAQTFPNRMYLQAATSQGLIATDIQAALAQAHPAGGTIWEKLADHGISWNDYVWDLPDIALFPKLLTEFSDRIKTFRQFLDDCHAGTLPQVSIVSPGATAYSEENPADVQLGEAYSASIINAVMESPAWPRTVLLFMYDEHGGYYDHVAPPAAIPPDDIPPNVAPAPGAPAAWNIYGLRVPAFVISPFARRNYVSHVVHDHTSVLRFIETKFNLGALTRRDANASNLLDALDLHHPSFLEPPTLAAPGLPASGSTCEPQTPPPPTTPDATTVMPTAYHAGGRHAPLSDTQAAKLELLGHVRRRVPALTV